MMESRSIGGVTCRCVVSRDSSVAASVVDGGGPFRVIVICLYISKNNFLSCGCLPIKRR